jgi:hypothetical protein
MVNTHQLYHCFSNTLSRIAKSVRKKFDLKLTVPNKCKLIRNISAFENTGSFFSKVLAGVDSFKNMHSVLCKFWYYHYNYQSLFFYNLDR